MRFVTLCLAISALAVSAVTLAAVKTQRATTAPEAEPMPAPVPPLARVLPERYPLRFSVN